jgi:hypothetical protein
MFSAKHITPMKEYLHKINIIAKILSKEASYVWFSWLDKYTKEY